MTHPGKISNESDMQVEVALVALVVGPHDSLSETLAHGAPGLELHVTVEQRTVVDPPEALDRPLLHDFERQGTPGLVEELLFRGSLLSAMRKDWRWPRILAWQALYFALVHASIYRLLPTGILGALLAAIALRSRSVVPAMVLHISYNGLLVLGTAGRLEFVEAGWFAYAPWAAIPGVLLLALPSQRR